MNIVNLFQCPRGHFLFSGSAEARRAIPGEVRFNALAGIFCFLACMPFLVAYTVRFGVFQCPRGHFLFSGGLPWRCSSVSMQRWFQCPRGHFLFSGVILVHSTRAGPCSVSMPSRAFFVFWPPRSQYRTRVTISSRFNALAGIFCFLAEMKPGVRLTGNKVVSMPSRAFFVFWRTFSITKIPLTYYVSMPSRAFFVFWPYQILKRLARRTGIKFQCPRGHFLFSGGDDGEISFYIDLVFQCPRGHFLFSGVVKAGMFETGGRKRFNALAGIFCFLAQGQKPSTAKRPFSAFQCPRGHFLFSGRSIGAHLRVHM